MPVTSGATRAEAAIEDLRQRGGIFVDAVRATRMPMALTDPNLPGNPIVFANDAFLKLSGYRMEEVLGQQPHFMNGRNTDPKDAACFAEALRGDQDDVVETVQYRKNGSRFVATVLVSAFKDSEGRVLNHFMSWLDVTRRVEAEDEVAELRASRKVMLQQEEWLKGQSEAFKAAVNGAPLKKSLEILIDTALGLVPGLWRCAFYIADEDCKTLRHVAGMPDSYAEKVDGFPIGKDSLACGLAVGTGTPVLAHDVHDDPRWKGWSWLGDEYGFRSCWSFPIQTEKWKPVGSCTWYFPEARSPTERELEIAKSLVGTASIIVAQDRSLSERRASEERLRRVVQTDAVGILFFDAQGFVIDANPASLTMTGYSRQQMENRELHWRRMTPPEWLEVTEAQWRKFDETGRIGPYEKQLFMADGTCRWMLFAGQALGDGTMVEYFIDITERKQAEQAAITSEQHAQMLLAELQHRVRNTLSIVRSIARRTAESSTSAEDMLAHFQGRLDAFSRVQAAVTRNPGGGVDLQSLIEDELVAHAAHEGQQLSLDGPRVALKAQAAERMSLAIHELTTNAVKHGALISGRGCVRINWTKEKNGGGEELVLNWAESGVEIDTSDVQREGFGMELLRRSLPYDLGAKTAVDLTPTGLQFELRMPLPGASGMTEVNPAP